HRTRSRRTKVQANRQPDALDGGAPTRSKSERPRCCTGQFVRACPSFHTWIIQQIRPALFDKSFQTRRARRTTTAAASLEAPGTAETPGTARTARTAGPAGTKSR